MGNSKAIFLTAVTLIVGVYAIKFREADSKVVSIAISRMQELQANQLAKAAVALAVEELSKESSNDRTLTRQKTILGSKCSYVIRPRGEDGDRQVVTATIQLGNETQTAIAYIERKQSGRYYVGSARYRWSKWETTKIYLAPTKKG